MTEKVMIVLPDGTRVWRPLREVKEAPKETETKEGQEE